MEEDEKIYGEVLEVAIRSVCLDYEDILQIHKYVLWNSVPTEQLRRYVFKRSVGMI